jgi:D-amino-acid dehydrogenase
MDADSHSAMTVFEDEVRLSGSVGLEKPDGLLEIWRKIAPAMMDQLGEPYAAWTGMRPVSATGCPIMGATEAKGLFVNAGHAHMGWTQCAGAGEVVAEAVFSRLP